MSTLFPAALDNYSDPAAGDSLTGHAQKHTDLNDAVEAIEAFVGIDGTPAPGTINARLISVESASGGASLNQISLDFGTVPVYSKAISFADAAITATSKIIMTPHAADDELEMDGFVCAVRCFAGSATAYIQAIPGPVTGTRLFNYTIG